MADLSRFPITHRWPARHPERLQLYSLPTPNGVKVAILLEELGSLVAITGIAWDSFDAADLERSAEAVAGLLRGLPFDSVEILREPRGDAAGHPAVVTIL